MRTRTIAGAILVAVIIAGGLMASWAFPRWTSPATNGDSSPTDNPPDGALSLSMSLASTKRILHAGEPANMVLEIRNVGRDVIWLVFSTSCRLTYSVWSAKGSLVYDRPQHEGCATVESRTRLAQGEGAIFRFSWDQTADDGRPVPGGQTYRIRASLRTSDLSSRSVAETMVVVEPGVVAKKLTLEARTDREQYAPGDLANITVVLTNVGGSAVDINSPDSCTFSFFVLDAHGIVVFSIPADVACFMVISSFTLAPGETRSELVAMWDLRGSNGAILPPGWYAIYPALFHAETDPQCIVEVSATSIFIAP